MSIPDNFTDPDAFYSALVQAHEGLSDEESERLNLALVFILASRVGDAAALADALEQALATAKGEAGEGAAADGGEAGGEKRNKKI